MKASSWLILTILTLHVLCVTAPAYAQGFSITLNPSTVNAGMSSLVSVTVVVTNLDGNPHVIQLSLTSEGSGYSGWPASFNPNPVAPAAVPGAVAVSTLTLPVPEPDEVCVGQSNPGPYYIQFVVRATDVAVAGGSVVSASLRVNLAPMAYPLSVTIETSKPAYRIGETVTLSMNANVPAEYYLKVRQPDGSIWASAHSYLPATFRKEAAEPLGTYTAELIAYYCGTAQASASFTVTPDTYDITISFAGLPTDLATTLQLDGSKIADMKGGDVQVLSYPIDTSHTFQVDQYVDGASGYRYYCASNSWTSSAEGSYTFNYATQVYLDIGTDPSSLTDVTQSGWFALGTPVSISEVPAELDDSAGVKYRFAEWTVDGTARTQNGFEIIMDAPHTLVAKYDAYFKLTVISEYGNPRGDDYYKSGDTATFSVDSPVGFVVQQIFVEWTGDYNGKEPTGSVTMDGPKTVTATWTVSYFQLLLIVGAIALIVVLAVLLLLWRRRASPAAVKPPPPPPPTSAPAEAEPEVSTAVMPPSVVKRCANCGHELAETQVYCPECGEKQTE